MSAKKSQIENKAKSLREEQARKERHSRIIVISVVVAVIIAAAAAVTFIVVRNSSAITGGKVELSEQVKQTRGFTLSKTGDGKPVAGVPNLELYFDYTCPHCAEVDSKTFGDLSKRAAKGEINLILHPVNTQIRYYPGFGFQAAQASMTVASKSVSHFAKFHEGLTALYLKNSVAAKASGAGSVPVFQDEAKAREAILQVAKESGVDPSLLSGLGKDAFAPTLTQWTDQWIKLAQDGKIQGVVKDQIGTPMFVRDNKVVPLNSTEVNALYAQAQAEQAKGNSTEASKIAQQAAALHEQELTSGKVVEHLVTGK